LDVIGVLAQDFKLRCRNSVLGFLWSLLRVSDLLSESIVLRRGYEFMGRRIDSYSFFMRSLRRLVDKYEGEYVALVDASIVAHGRNGKEVYYRTRKAHPGSRILLAQVPVKEAMVLSLALDSHSLPCDWETVKYSRPHPCRTVASAT
jgi:hypothetical protein